MSAIASKYTKYTKEAKKDLSKVGKSAKKVYKKVASKKNVAAVKKTVSKVGKYASKAGHAVVDKLEHLRFAAGGEISDATAKKYADRAIAIVKGRKETKEFEYSDIEGASGMYAMEWANSLTRNKPNREEEYKKLYPELKAKILPLVQQEFPLDTEMANFDFEGLFAPANKEEEVLIEKVKENKIAYKDFLSRVNAVKDVIEAFSRSANANKLDYQGYQSWIAHVKETIEGLSLLGGGAARYAETIESKFNAAVKAHDYGKNKFVYPPTADVADGKHTDIIPANILRKFKEQLAFVLGKDTPVLDDNLNFIDDWRGTVLISPTIIKDSKGVISGLHYYFPDSEIDEPEIELNWNLDSEDDMEIVLRSSDVWHKFRSTDKHNTYAKGGIIPMSELPANTAELVDMGKVTYRGTGNSGESKIKVEGKEYVISSADFDALGGLQKIRFSAPFRKGENGGEVPVDDDDTTVLEISNTSPLSTQLQKLTGDSWNVWDFESVDGGRLTTETPFRHKKTGKVFKVKDKEYAEGGAALTRDQEIAKEILDLLGGRNKLHAMTGAYDFFAVPRGLVFKLKNPKANYVKIILNGMDTYDIEIGRIRRGTEYKVVAQGDGYYGDMLVPFIEKSTGMYLRFEEGGSTERPKPKTYHQWLQMITNEYSRDESAMPSKMELSNMYDAYLRENFNPEPFYYKMVDNRWVPMNTLPTEKDWEMYRSIQIYDEDGNGGMKIKGIGLY